MGLFDPNDMMEDEMDDRTSLKEEEETDKSYDTHVEAMFESNSGDGSGWYLDHMATFHENTTAQAGGGYYSFPAAYSAPLPPQHPLRVIAKIMDDAPSGSVVRVYAYMLTDMDAIDLLAHHAKHKTVNVILHPNTQSCNRMTQFFNEFGNSARRHFANVRVAPVTGPNGSRFTQMHIKGVLTESLSAFGSYNLTYRAKHASWEMITLKNTTATDIEFFDNLWASCRPMQEAEPNLLALAESPSRNKRARTTKG
eukprot:scaffold73483_cov46-Attheya_sp.AAC.2